MAASNRSSTFVRMPNARVLDYRQLKVTIQVKPARPLPTIDELRKSFSVYGECNIHRIGKSNQFMVHYTTPNAGFNACTKQNNATIKQGTLIVKYQWNTYCPSIFYSQNDDRSACSKGSNCDLIHSFKQEHEAFVPTNNITKDKLAFERFKLSRFHMFKEYDCVEAILEPNKSLTDSPTSSSSSSSIQSMSKRVIIPNASLSRTQSQEQKIKKQQALLLLKQQLQSGKSPNFKIFSNQRTATKQMRRSPPLAPMQTEDASEAASSHSSKSTKSVRSARSTVYVPKSAVSELCSESDSSSSQSIQNGESIVENDWNKLNDEELLKDKNAQTDTISMRYLCNNTDSNKTGDEKCDIKSKTKANEQKNEQRKMRKSPPVVNVVHKEEEKDRESENLSCESPKTVSSPSIGSAERVAIRSVQSVLGSNKVPIIDPNKRTVSYIKSQIAQKTNNNAVEHAQHSEHTRVQLTNHVTNAPNVFPRPMQPQMVHNMNTMNQMNMAQNAMHSAQQHSLLSAPPYYPNNRPFPQNPMAQFMNPMAGMTGSILAGTLRPVAHPQHNNMNMNAMYYANNGRNVHNNNNNNMNMVHAPHVMEREKKVHHKKKNSAKFIHESNCDLAPPNTEYDYHWLCYHFRSGKKYSCTFGRECKWRHYDFEMRADIVTAWHPSKPVRPRDRPKMKQLADARKLKKSLEVRYRWLVDRKHSVNPYLVNNAIGASAKKGRVNNKYEARQKDEELEILRAQLMSTQLKEMEKKESEEMDEKQKNIEAERKQIEEEEEDNEQQNEDERSYSLDHHDMDHLRTAVAMLDPFNSEEISTVNYYLIGQLAAQTLSLLEKKISSQKK